MGNIKEIKNKNWACYFFNDMMNIEKFWLKIIKNRQNVMQKHWYLLYGIHHNEKY